MKTILLEMVGLQFGTKGIRKYLHLSSLATNTYVSTLNANLKGLIFCVVFLKKSSPDTI
ncbi:hypothetical protein HS9_01430 [Bacillus velezensis]|nr:hypothetical protein HS9_01430 [Bacillus velezensis]